MEKKYYFLIGAMLVYTDGIKEKTKHYNVLVVSDFNYVNRKQIGLAQQQAQVRFFSHTEEKEKKTYPVTDVYIQSINRLGYMTFNEFHEGFETEPTDISEPKKETTEEAKLGI